MPDFTLARTFCLVVAGLAGGASPGSAQSAPPRPISLAAPNATLTAEFSLISSVRELADGRVLAVDRSERKLVVGDWSNRTVSLLGRNGSGPGEYLQPAMLFSLGGDSTLLPDLRNGRWRLLTGASIAATVGPDSPALRQGARSPLGADRGGHVLLTMSIGGAEPRREATMPRLDSTQLVRVSRTTGDVDTLAMLKARPTTIKIDGPAERPTAISVRMNPLATGELAMLFPDGWIAIARLDPYRVDWIAPDGKRTDGSPLPFERVRLDEREQRAWLDRQAERNGNAAPDPRSYPDWPAFFPPFLPEALLPAPDGRLWVRRVATSGNLSPPYDVINRQGALVARVAVEKDVVVVGFGRGVVFTSVTDENGLQKLQRRPYPAF